MAFAQSRFALLKIEDDDDNESIKSKTNNKPENQQAANKKKNKKKKKVEQKQENDELKHLAFAKPGSARQKTQSGGTEPNKQKNKQNGHSGATEGQWNEWMKADTNYAAESYEKDLEKALLMSKIEFEEKKDTVKLPKESNVEENGSKDKKKKKKDKPQTMSLDEFNAGGKVTQSDELGQAPVGSSSKSDMSSNEADPKFFRHVEGDVERILRKEKMQEEYQKQYAAERVMTSKHDAELAKRDKETEFLKATVKKLEEEFKQVKKRNKQLCVILAQGEMKEKAEVLMQVQQLTEVKDELTQQVQELTGELEKERSKVHSMKTELDKLKGHGTKHSGK